MTKKLSATQLRKSLFETLDKVERGASVMIERDGKVIARLIPSEICDWRDTISQSVRVNGKVEDAFAPMDDIFND